MLFIKPVTDAQGNPTGEIKIYGGPSSNSHGVSAEYQVPANINLQVLNSDSIASNNITSNNITSDSIISNTINATSYIGVDYTSLKNKPVLPSSLLDLNILDGIFGQVLTTDGNGNFFFTTIQAGGASSANDYVIDGGTPSTIYINATNIDGGGP